MRVIFMGTPEFAVPTLLELVAHGHEIAAVAAFLLSPDASFVSGQAIAVDGGFVAQ